MHAVHGSQGGFFVDVAANHPRALSNTRALERDYGWDGICVEPQESLWRLLLARRRCKVVAAPVTADEGVVSFEAAAHDRDKGRLAAESSNRTVTLQSVSLSRVLRALGAPNEIDYLSLDVEGAELQAMRGFAFAEFRASVLTVERPGEELSQLLRAHGYRFQCENGWFGDEMWFHASFSSVAAGPPFLPEAEVPNEWPRLMFRKLRDRCALQTWRWLGENASAHMRNRTYFACIGETRQQCALGPVRPHAFGTYAAATRGGEPRRR